MNRQISKSVSSRLDMITPVLDESQGPQLDEIEEAFKHMTPGEIVNWARQKDQVVRAKHVENLGQLSMDVYDLIFMSEYSQIVLNSRKPKNSFLWNYESRELGNEEPRSYPESQTEGIPMDEIFFNTIQSLKFIRRLFPGQIKHLLINLELFTDEKKVFQLGEVFEEIKQVPHLWIFGNGQLQDFGATTFLLNKLKVTETLVVKNFRGIALEKLESLSSIPRSFICAPKGTTPEEIMRICSGRTHVEVTEVTVGLLNALINQWIHSDNTTLMRLTIQTKYWFKTNETVTVHDLFAGLDHVSGSRSLEVVLKDELTPRLQATKRTMNLLRSIGLNVQRKDGAVLTVTLDDTPSLKFSMRAVYPGQPTLEDQSASSELYKKELREWEKLEEEKKDRAAKIVEDLKQDLHASELGGYIMDPEEKLQKMHYINMMERVNAQLSSSSTGNIQLLLDEEKLDTNQMNNTADRLERGYFFLGKKPAAQPAKKSFFMGGVVDASRTSLICSVNHRQSAWVFQVNFSTRREPSQTSFFRYIKAYPQLLEDYFVSEQFTDEQFDRVLTRRAIRKGKLNALIPTGRSHRSQASTSLDIYGNIVKQQQLSNFILGVARSIFQSVESVDAVIIKIMNFAQNLVDADRASLFLVDVDTREVYSRVFDVGVVNSEGQKEIRFEMSKGIAGHVATTGDGLNIIDAYKDNRFNSDVDIKTGYTTKTILCMPIMIKGSVIGVVQMVNKHDGVFTRQDEDAFEIFAGYCGLALHHAKLYEEIQRSEQKHQVSLEVLAYHSVCSEEEMYELKNTKLPREIQELETVNFSAPKTSDFGKALYAVYMFRKLFKGSLSFNPDDLIRFVLTVRKNYRNVPYHNWSHGWSVAQAMFATLMTNREVFTMLEALAFYVACLCHDLDHRGKNNAYMKVMETPLAAIYSTSVMENHHFNQTVTILQHDGHNILKSLTAEEYKQTLSLIKHCILATDLSLFFGNKAKLSVLLDDGKFDINQKEHRSLTQAVLMTSCDLISSAKAWNMQIETVKVIYEEFYEQGDAEKRDGKQPIPMMDREKSNQLPQMQVGFMRGICLPCYELISRILPKTDEWRQRCEYNTAIWEKLAEEQKKRNEKKQN